MPRLAMRWIAAASMLLVGAACASVPSPSVRLELALPSSVPSAATPLPSLPSAAPPPGEFRLVGHEPLFGRGMNGALALAGDHAYVGNRTDGAEGHLNPGILVVDIGEPAAPTVVHEIGPPGAGNPGESTRELRVWPGDDLLIVMSVACDPIAHLCGGGARPTFRFFDIRADLRAEPVLLATYEPRQTPHEFFLWVDPEDASRALLYVANTGSRVDLSILDISHARDGSVDEIATWSMDTRRQGAGLHSVSVSPDGRQAYMAFLTGGFFMLDTSAIAEGTEAPPIAPIGSLDDRLVWQGAGPHSAVPIPNRPLVLTTDEVYGGPGPLAGCPWGWVRLIDVADAARPTLRSEYRVVPWNDEANCDAVPDETDRTSTFSSHNPTVTEHLALVAWHAAGLQLIDTSDPGNPLQAAAFVPEPLASVVTEDPVLSSGRDMAVVWSYPIVRDGLVYVVDVRNGLFVLSYEGPLADELSGVGFLEGNSNIGSIVETPAG